MKIDDAVDALTRLRQTHGNVQVFFDCPNCGQSFSPTTIVAVGVVQAKAEKE